MRTFIAIITLFGVYGCREMIDETPRDPEAFSVRLLETVRNKGLYRAKLDTLSNSSIISLKGKLDSDAKKKAFWINLYNAFVQIRLRETPQRFSEKELFFEEDHFRVGVARFSLKDIENGILNGNFDGNFPELLKSLAVLEPDPLTYFALNCGARECPPIAYYSSFKISEQLETAKKVFIRSTSDFDPFTNEVSTSELLQWHETAFGGHDTLINWLRIYNVIPANTDPDLVFKKYDWSPNTGK